MTPKILIVDDNEFIVEIISHMLKNNGYEVCAVSAGEHVIPAINSEHPDLVIMDANLPDADGRKLCQELKISETTSRLPVIICSGRTDITDCLNQVHPPDDVLPKPFDMQFLIDKVKRQLAA